MRTASAGGENEEVEALSNAGRDESDTAPFYRVQGPLRAVWRDKNPPKPLTQAEAKAGAHVRCLHVFYRVRAHTIKAVALSGVCR